MPRRPAALELDGRDMFDPATPPPDHVLIAWGPNVSVRTRDWNLVIDSTRASDRCELYDLQADPGESANVASQHPGRVAALTALLTDALGPLPYQIRHRGDRRQAPPHVTAIRG